jgi:tetratricopeptide (TPR) repeat protein
MRWINAFFLICIFLCVTPLTDVFGVTDIGMMRRADSLFAQGNYFEASIAYERVIYNSGSAFERVSANLKKAEALKQIGEFAKARNDLQRSFAFRGNDSLRLELLYQMAFCAYMDGAADEAHIALLQLRRAFGPVRQQRLYLLEGLVLSDQGSWDALREHLQLWLMDFEADSLTRQNTMLAYGEILGEGLDGISRSPDKARLWSTFIPGAGQLYAGEPGWGVLNAFSQLAGLAGFGLLAYNGFYVAGSIVGLGAFQSFYFGGIKQAGELTTENTKSHLEKLQMAMAHLLFDVADKLSE